MIKHDKYFPYFRVLCWAYRPGTPTHLLWILLSITCCLEVISSCLIWTFVSCASLLVENDLCVHDVGLNKCFPSPPVCLNQVSGRSLAHLSQRDALRILAASQRPITMQIKGRRGCGTEADRGDWEPLPLNLQHLNLPLPRMGVGLNASSPSYQDRYTHTHTYMSILRHLVVLIQII